MVRFILGERFFIEILVVLYYFEANLYKEKSIIIACRV